MGADRLIAVDLHCTQVQGFTRMVVDNYEAAFAGLSYFLKEIKDKDNLVVVSPDAGGVGRAKSFHSHFSKHGHNGVGLAMISKERKVANQVDNMVLVGDV
eukprot:CAMPEP_0116872986 /NCGR_PEP_ID=MMETSP0463-20121206/3934_1 /TAXON_ID=181622 /ORGANISM="Strombidinopsis sp, Strain SopsisLIS2011" /LENGTH=99 /DNA_ID=CAMNT_0004514151 /DNA_START=599 /DNA_END=898 /DNA_ORIENTATION=+